MTAKSLRHKFNFAARAVSASEQKRKDSAAFLPPSPPAEKATARQDQAGKASTDDGARDKLASNLTTRVSCSVDIKVGQSAFDSRDQRRLGLRAGDSGMTYRMFRTFR